MLLRPWGSWPSARRRRVSMMRCEVATRMGLASETCSMRPRAAEARLGTYKKSLVDFSTQNFMALHTRSWVGDTTSCLYLVRVSRLPLTGMGTSNRKRRYSMRSSALQKDDHE